MNFLVKKNIYANSKVLLIITLVIISSAGVIAYTNKTLHSIENNLPSALLTELDSLTTTLDSLSNAVNSARLAAATGDRQQINQLKKDVATT